MAFGPLFLLTWSVLEIPIDTRNHELGGPHSMRSSFRFLATERCDVCIKVFELGRPGTATHAPSVMDTGSRMHTISPFLFDLMRVSRSFCTHPLGISVCGQRSFWKYQRSRACLDPLLDNLPPGSGSQERRCVILGGPSAAA